jgi:uncharacterized protein
MKSKLINSDKQKTFALVFDAGDEVISSLTEFAKQENLYASQFTAIGAFEKAVLGYFDLTLRDYKKIEVNEQVEVLSVMGDIAMNKELQIHAHVVLGKSDGSTVGGHLLKAWVKPTLEVILTESPAHLKKKMNEEFDLPLIDLSQ